MHADTATALLILGGFYAAGILAIILLGRKP